ncbi:hypothetical protein AGR5A_Lc10145 [Agrobacterium genomosp. 5 str. CFBP 6626]|nr:hypothetical protein AGR5A_Lc10145 [Agrobacterium genomosp. 5 str. CFBP 6626]
MERNQKGVRTIQSTGNAYNHAFDATGLQTTGKALRLYLKSFLAESIKLAFVIWNERKAGNFPLQANIVCGGLKMKTDMPIIFWCKVTPIRDKATIPQPFRCQKFKVDIRDNHAGACRKPLGFCQKSSSFIDHCMAVPSEIGG